MLTTFLAILSLVFLLPLAGLSFTYAVQSYWHENDNACIAFLSVFITSILFSVFVSSMGGL